MTLHIFLLRKMILIILNHTVLFASVARSEMVLNVDFRDIQANEALLKFGF